MSCNSIRVQILQEEPETFFYRNRAAHASLHDYCNSCHVYYKLGYTSGVVMKKLPQ